MGAGASPSVVLVHGAGHNVETWNILADELVPDIHVVGVDLPGHGWSYTGEAITWDLCAFVVREAVQALGIRDHVVVGHSWGARVALCYGAKHKCRAILTLDGVLGLVDPCYSEADLANLGDKLVEVPPPGMTWTRSREDFESEMSSLLLLAEDATASSIRALRERQAVLLPDGNILTRPDLSEYLAIQRGCYGPGQVLDPSVLYAHVMGNLIGIFSTNPPDYYPSIDSVLDFWQQVVVPVCPSAQIIVQDTARALHWSCAPQIATIVRSLCGDP
jgi:pimeloyl-ACP methyl ester carboxylesterase